jgi:hypothetical protein
MYKNVSNQRIIALVLLFSSCFAAIRLNAQAISANSAIATANTNIETDKKAHQSDAYVTPERPAIDTTWKPVRRIWGLVFGDLYYNAHADAGNRGAETNYNGVPTYRNAFQFRRIYLGYDYDIDKNSLSNFYSRLNQMQIPPWQPVQVLPYLEEIILQIIKCRSISRIWI